MRFSGAIFDCDGTLVDTRRCWEFAYRAAIGQAGAKPSVDGWVRLLASLNGASVEIAAERLSAGLGCSISVDFLHLALAEAVAAESLRPMPGAGRLLSLLQGRMPLAVASNGPGAMVDAVLRATELRDFFSHIVSAEEVDAPKPDPGVYLEACRRLSVDPPNVVAFEDSPMGAAAVRAAGIFLVRIPSDAGCELEASSLGDDRIIEALGVAGLTSELGS